MMIPVDKDGKAIGPEYIDDDPMRAFRKVIENHPDAEGIVLTITGDLHSISDGGAALQEAAAQTQRTRRRDLPALIRYSLISAAGALLAVVTFYMLRLLGY